MNLKRIKSFGFKTFADPTTLEFAGGITAIVGPNGSGKSNMVDAFRWVLGETSSRSLRAGKLEDVIFAGNEKRKPLGLAEVSILFDNTQKRLPVEYAEVEITRRAYRGGESEYFINRTPVRLRDISELLMGTGLGSGSHAIVSQGQIDAILTSKPVDRRALFEETAGISLFLSRKAESLRRLDHTEQNAIRISDLIAEHEHRIPELETQVRRAKRYRKLDARVRDLEILGYLRAGASRRSQRDGLRIELERNEEARAVAAARAAALGAELSDTRTRAYRHELALEELRSALQAQRAELARVEAEYAAALARREALERQSTQTSADVARVAQERESLTSTIAQLSRQLGPLQRDVEASTQGEAAAQGMVSQARARLDAVFTELREIEAGAADHAAKRAERRVLGENFRAQAEGLEHELEAQRERASRLEIATGALAHRCGDVEREASQLEERQLDTKGRCEDADRDVAAAQEELARALSVHRQRSAEVTGAESRLHTIEELENSLEGHVPGTRAVVDAWQRGELHGIEGIVSNLITADEGHARAMDVAFGVRLSNVVTVSSRDAERAIEFLNRKEAGRATFLPLDTLGNRDGRRLPADLSRVAGVIGYAHALVQTQERYRNVVNFLVGNVLIVDQLATGIALVRERGFRDTIVTLTGEQIVGGGAITGGRFQRERSILSRRAAARTLAEALVGLRAGLLESETALHAAHVETEAAIERRELQRGAAARAELALAELRAEMTAAAVELQRRRDELAQAHARVDHLQEETQRLRERQREVGGAEPDDDRRDRERQRLEAALAGAREDVARAETAQSEAAHASSGLRERTSAATAEREAAAARLGMLDQDGARASVAREEMLSHIGELLSQTRTLHARIDVLRREAGDTQLQLETARREREALSDAQTRLESDLRLAENAERDALAGGERHRTRLAEIEAELGMLVSQFAQNPATQEECDDVQSRYETQADDVVGELPRLREELTRLSVNVNLNADAQREELLGRQTFLREQLDDLAKARETLLQSIREIEGETQTQFNATFETVSAAFADMYARLVPGGLAKMWQTDPGNLSESGIEIAVQPPGKKQMPLATLSGGERAMSVAALIFALIAVRPSPFYLLDEVDAALDDANIASFSDLVKQFAGQSQMLLVTHNKKTMEIADRMYGVTMPEAGVSSIISAELSPRSSELALA